MAPLAIIDLASSKLHNNLSAFKDLEILVFDGVGGFFDCVELDVAESIDGNLVRSRSSMKLVHGEVSHPLLRPRLS